MPPLKLKLLWETEFHDDLLRLFIVSEEEKSHICSLSVSFHVVSCFPVCFFWKTSRRDILPHTHARTRKRTHVHARARAHAYRDEITPDEIITSPSFSFLSHSPLPNVTFNWVTFAVALKTWPSRSERQKDNNKTKMKTNNKRKKTHPRHLLFRRKIQIIKMAPGRLSSRQTRTATAAAH